MPTSYASALAVLLILVAAPSLSAAGSGSGGAAREQLIRLATEAEQEQKRLLLQSVPAEGDCEDVDMEDEPGTGAEDGAATAGEQSGIMAIIERTSVGLRQDWLGGPRCDDEVR